MGSSNRREAPKIRSLGKPISRLVYATTQEGDGPQSIPMTKPNRNPRVEPLLRELRSRLPNIDITVDAPLPDKTGWVEVQTKEGQHFVFECPVKGGYCLSSSPEGDHPIEGYGEGGDEVFEDEHEAVTRLLELVESKVP